jgi:hypothetical protein
MERKGGPHQLTSTGECKHKNHIATSHITQYTTTSNSLPHPLPPVAAINDVRQRGVRR